MAANKRITSFSLNDGRELSLLFFDPSGAVLFIFRSLAVSVVLDKGWSIKQARVRNCTVKNIGLRDDKLVEGEKI